jgi:extracellular matrix regulatory protein A
MRLINIGFGNVVCVDRITAVVNPDSAPVKRLVQEARDDKRLIDATQGRRTRAVIVMNSGQTVLAAIQPETIASRASSREYEPHMEEKQI